MAGLIYFLPDVKAESLLKSPEELVSRGLGEALADVIEAWQPPHNCTVADLRAGSPSGKNGCLVYPMPINGSLPRTPGYRANEQQWEDAGGYWIGFDKEQRPTPDDLQRPEMLDGYPRKLGDGHEWIVPIIRTPRWEDDSRWGGRSHLPQGFSLGVGGKMQMKPLPTYAEVWELSAKAWDAVRPEPVPTSNEEAAEMAAKFLAVNYRVSLAECLALDLFTTSNLVKVLMAACNTDFIVEAISQKKTEDTAPDSLNTPPGDGEPSPATDPAGEPST